MRSKWLNNKGATNQVKVLLEQAGIPLELQAAEIGRDFCSAHAGAKGLHLSSEKIVYSSGGAEATYREIDQCVSIYEEFEVGTHTGIQLQVSLPIECKYRNGLEVFCFPVDDKTLCSRLPVHSGLRGSVLFTYLKYSFANFPDSRPCNIVTLEVAKGETPKRIHDENLVYNAAGALYDFIRFDLAPEGAPTSSQVDHKVDELGLFTKFQRYIRKRHYPWEYVLDDWINEISDDQCRAFNTYYFGDRPLYHGVGAHVPVVCVNGPLYSVCWGRRKGITAFNEIPYCVTTIRKQGWPGAARPGLLNTRPEVPVFLTNEAHLAEVLEIGYSWSRELKKILVNADTRIVDRWALEAYFTQRVRRHYQELEASGRYRSDLHWS